MIRPEPITRRTVTPRAVLAVGSLGAALAFVDATIVNVAFPDIREDFSDASLAGISWVLNAYNIVFAAFIVAAGRIADLLGRKRLFEWGVVLFTFASLLCAAAPSIELLVAARIVQAIGAAIVVPASLALVLEAWRGGARAHGVALWSAAAALAAGLGPSLGGVLVELGGWRLAFLVNLPLGALAVMASRRMLVESRAPGRRTVPDLAGALLLAAGTAALTLGIVKGDDWGWASPAVLVSFGAAVALAIAFVERCTWHHSPMIDLGLLRIRSLAAANAITLTGAAGFYAYVLCNVLFLTTVWGYSVLEAGLAITPGPFVAALAARPATRLAEGIGAAPTITLGALLWAAGVVYMAAVVGPAPDFVGEWLPGMVILGIGAGIAFPVSGSAAVAEVTGGRFATATGINSIARQLGAVLGVALLVAIVGTPTPAEVADAFDRGWIFAAGCFVLTGIGALAIGRITAPAEEDGATEEPTRRPAPLQPPSPRPLADADAPRPAAPRPRRTPAEFLRQVPMFAGLPAEALDRIAARAVPVHVHAGELLFRQGDPPDGVYVVVSGRLEVLWEENGDEHLLRVLGPDSVVGELALIADTERSASARARRDSELLKLTRAEFDALMAADRRFTGELVRMMGLQLQRSRALEGPASGAASVIALTPGHAGLPVGPIAAALTSELRRGGRVARLDAPSAVPLVATAEAELLERYEHDHDQVLLVAADDSSAGRRMAGFLPSPRRSGGRHRGRAAAAAGRRGADALRGNGAAVPGGRGGRPQPPGGVARDAGAASPSHRPA